MHRTCTWLAILAGGPLALLAFSCAPCLAATTELISVGVTHEADDYHLYPSISADGRFVAFASNSANIVPGDTNGARDVFVRDRLLSVTERVSIGTAGEQANGGSDYPAVSGDGRFVAFVSAASNLVPDDTNGKPDVFVRDRTSGTTGRLSVSTTGEQGDEKSDSSLIAISADGTCVAFTSDASNLVPDDTNGWADVFVRDRAQGMTERVSVTSEENQASWNSWTYSTAVSADGRFVAFGSAAPEFGYGAGGVPAQSQAFLRDRLTGLTEPIGLSTGGDLPQGLHHNCDGGSVSADGRFVAFNSEASNLVSDDTGGFWDVFVRDRLLSRTERVSISSAGEEGNYSSSAYAVSADGRFVVFASSASNLVPDDTNNVRDVFVHDRLLGTTERVSVSDSGQQANGESSMSDLLAISGDGRFVAYSSAASNLVPGDTNDARDLFLRDRYSFQDVPADHWAYGGVVACATASIVAGYPDGLYHPDLQVTRDQMAVYVARALVSPSGDAAIPDPGPPPTFSDVPPDFWAYQHIEYAASQGVVEGYPDGTYQPSTVVDRGQMAVYIARAMVAPAGDAAIADPQPPYTFLDVPGEDNAWAWCHKHVEYLAAQGVVHGYDDGLYHPEIVVTRDQMAVYIARAFELTLGFRHVP